MTVSSTGYCLEGNTATGDGGGIWNGHSLTLRNSTVAQNRAKRLGGGVFNKGQFSSSNSTVTGNSPDQIFPTP